jgi:1-deoxy-D-xylulose-5-phosphate reductoisomerase
MGARPLLPPGTGVTLMRTRTELECIVPAWEALARAALERGCGATTVLNAANEIAVSEFLHRRLGFAGIPVLVEATLEAASGEGLMREPESVGEALAIDHDSRSLAQDLLPEIAAKAF